VGVCTGRVRNHHLVWEKDPAIPEDLNKKKSFPRIKPGPGRLTDGTLRDIPKQGYLLIIRTRKKNTGKGRGEESRDSHAFQRGK